MRPRSVFAAATLLTTVAVMSNAVVVAQTSKEWSQCTDGEGPIADVVISGPVAAPEATVRCGFGLLQQRAVLGQECRPANNSFGWKGYFEVIDSVSKSFTNCGACSSSGALPSRQRFPR